MGTKSHIPTLFNSYATAVFGAITAFALCASCPEARGDTPEDNNPDTYPETSIGYPTLRASKTKYLAGLRSAVGGVSPVKLRSTVRKSRRSADQNRVQANLKGIAIDGMSSLNYQRLLGRQFALGVAANHFQYRTPQGAGEERGEGYGGEVFARYKPYRSRQSHEGIFVNVGLGSMAMAWQQRSAGIAGADKQSQGKGVYGTLTSGVSYQTAVYGSLLIEPRLDYILFSPIDSDAEKAVQRFEPTVAFGFGF